MFYKDIYLSLNGLHKIILRAEIIRHSLFLPIRMECLLRLSLVPGIPYKKPIETVEIISDYQLYTLRNFNLLTN